MRTVNKIIFLGVTLVILSSLCSTFSCLTDTYSYSDDTKKVDVNLTTAKLDSDAAPIELFDYKLPANETLNRTAFITRKNPKGSETGNSPVGENSSNHDSSVNHLMSDFSVAGNNNTNLTTNNSTLATLLIANFSSNVTSGYAPLSVQFIDLSRNATKWNRDFEDGSTSTEQNPVHIYPSSGTYTVKLTINDTNCTDSKLSSMNVLEKPAVALLPLANFSNNVSRGFVPFTIKFTDLSENATVWKWDFGDENNSTEQNPVHTYYVPGSYTVMLTACNENGTNSKCCTITVLQTIHPVANISSDVTSGHVPLSVQFNNSSENETVRSQNFEDENNSIEQNPVHTYSEAGNYTVKPVANDEVSQSTKTSEISVKKKNVSSNVTNGYAPSSPVQFKDLSENETVRSRNFEDENNSIEQNPVHTYYEAGNYTAKPVANDEARQSTKTSEISVKKKNVNNNVTSGYTPFSSAKFKDLSENATIWNRNFGDENNWDENNWDENNWDENNWDENNWDEDSSTELDPVNTYSETGNYTVKPVATNEAHQSKKTSEISVKEKSHNKLDFREQKTQ